MNKCVGLVEIIACPYIEHVHLSLNYQPVWVIPTAIPSFTGPLYCNNHRLDSYATEKEEKIMQLVLTNKIKCQ